MSPLLAESMTGI